MTKLDRVNWANIVKMRYPILVISLVGLCIGIAFYKTIPTVSADCVSEKYIFLEKISVTSSEDLKEELIQKETVKWPNSAIINISVFSGNDGFKIEYARYKDYTDAGDTE